MDNGRLRNPDKRQVSLCGCAVSQLHFFTFRNFGETIRKTYRYVEKQVLDLTMVDPDLRGFMGGFAAGHWGYLVPFKNREAEAEYSGKMVRFDLLAFDYASVTVSVSLWVFSR